MDGGFPGLGTVINVVAVVAGALLGMVAGHRFPVRVRDVVTDCLGLVTLLVAGLSALEVTSPALSGAVGSGVPVLVVLGSLLLGGILGSLLRIEDRLPPAGDRAHEGHGRGSRSQRVGRVGEPVGHRPHQR